MTYGNECILGIFTIKLILSFSFKFLLENGNDIRDSHLRLTLYFFIVHNSKIWQGNDITVMKIFLIDLQFPVLTLTNHFFDKSYLFHIKSRRVNLYASSENNCLI